MFKIHPNSVRAAFNKLRSSSNNRIETANFIFSLAPERHTSTISIFIYTRPKHGNAKPRQLGYLDENFFIGRTSYSNGFIEPKNREAVTQALDELKKVRVFR